MDIIKKFAKRQWNNLLDGIILFLACYGAGLFFFTGAAHSGFNPIQINFMVPSGDAYYISEETLKKHEKREWNGRGHN